MKGQTYKRCTCSLHELVDADGRRATCHRKHGAWYYRHDVPPGADGARRQAKRGGFGTEREARKAMNDSLAMLDRGVYVGRSRLSLAQYLDDWLQGRVNLRPATVVFYRVAVERYLKPELGKLALTDLRAHDIESAFRRIEQGVDGRGNPPSPALIARLKTTLRAALNVAVKRGLLHVNPAVHVEVRSHCRPAVQVWEPRPPVASWTPQRARCTGRSGTSSRPSDCAGARRPGCAGRTSTWTPALRPSPCSARRSAATSSLPRPRPRPGRAG